MKTYYKKKLKSKKCPKVPTFPLLFIYDLFYLHVILKLIP